MYQYICEPSPASYTIDVPIGLVIGDCGLCTVECGMWKLDCGIEIVDCG